MSEADKFNENLKLFSYFYSDDDLMEMENELLNEDTTGIPLDSVPSTDDDSLN